MKEKIFIKELTPDEQNDILNFICNKFSFKEQEKFKKFYLTMVEYIKTVRRSLESFKGNIDEIIDLFSKCGFDDEQIIEILTKEPSLLHADKNSIFWRILILGKLIDPKSDIDIRKEYIIKNPRILRISENVTYARIKYLESSVGKQYLKNDDRLTLRQFVKITHNEFKAFYGIDKEKLLSSYPFDNNAQLDVVSWSVNNELLNNIYEGKTK